MAEFDNDNVLGVSSKQKALDKLFGTASPAVKRKEQAVSSLVDIDTPRRRRAVEVLEVSRDTNPDEEAKTGAAARTLGVPYEAAQANPEAAHTAVRKNELDKLFRNAKITSEFLTDPSRARVAHDSVEQLSYIEGLSNSFVRGLLGVKQGFRQFQAESEYEDYKDSNRSYLEIMQDVAANTPGGIIGDSGAVGNIGITGHLGGLWRYATSRVFPTSREDYLLAQRKLGDVVAERAKFGMSGTAQEFMESVEQADGVLNKLAAVASNPLGVSAFGTEVGLEFLPQLIAAGGVTLATRNPQAGAFAIGSLSGATERYRSPVEFLQAAGVDVTDPGAAEALLADPELMKQAQEYGFTRGAIIGSIDALAGGLASKALAKNPMLSLALQTVLQGSLGGGGEAAAQLATTGEIDINEVIFEAVGEFATAPVDVVTVGGRPLVTRARDALQSARAEASVQTLDQMSEALQESPLTQRDPAAAAEHMAAVLRDKGVEEINIPASALNNLENVEVATLLEDLGVTSQMQDATQYDGDVSIDVRAFSEHVLQNPEVMEQLKSYVRVDPEGVTYAESLEVDEETQTALQEAEQESTQALNEVSRDTQVEPAADPQVEQVTQIAEHEAGMAAMFSTASEAGFTETQYASYIEAIKRMKDGARKAVEKRRLNREKKRLEKQYQETRESFRQEVEESLSQEPIYQAIQAIGVDRLDYDAVLRIMQGDVKAMERLPQSNGQRIYTRKGVKGVDPNAHADIYGFPGGDVMLFGFMDNPSFEQAVERELDSRVEREIPTNLTLRQEIQEALEVVHKDDNFSTVLAFELARLRQMRGQKRIKPALLRARAKNILKGYRVGSIRPAQLETLQRRESRRARKALREGDIEAAAKHKLNQAIAYEMTRESYNIQQKVEKGNRFLRKLQVKANQTRKRGTQRGLPIDHLEKIGEILGKFQFGPRPVANRRLQQSVDARSATPPETGETLKQWAKRKNEDEGIVMHIGPTVENADGSTNWQNLTLDEWTDVLNTVRDIAHAGREANKLRSEIEGLGVDQIVTEISTNLSANIAKNAPKAAKPVKEVTDVSAIDTMVDNTVNAWKRFGLDIGGMVLNAESVLRRIDGFKNLGTAYRFIKGGIDRAYTEGYNKGQIGYVRRTKAEAERLAKLFNMFSKTEQDLMWLQKDIPGVRRRLSRMEIIGTILNMGNAENMQAMIQSGQFTEMELQAILDSASKRDLDFVQGVWDFLDSFKPEIRETVRRRQNRNPVMVEAQPLETKYGVLRGGYFPLQYDMETSVLEKAGATSFDFEETRDMMLRGGFTVSHTQDGHTQSRVGSGGRRVKLDPFVLQQHMGQLIYDLEMGDAVHDAYKVLHHPDMKKSFSDLGKPQIWESLDLWLGDVITGEVHRGGFVESSLRHIRTGTTVSRLAFNVSTAALQPLGLFQSAALVGKSNMLRGLHQFVGWGKGQNPMAVAKWVTEQSGFMQERERSFNKDITDAQRGLHTGLLSKVTPGKTADVVADSMFLFIAKAQRFVDITTWLGAYHQGMQEFGTAADAIKHADRMVARTQGSGNFHERTNFERGTISKSVRNTEMVRLWSMFLSYFAAKMNVAYERTAKVDIRKNPMEIINYPVDLALMFMLEGVLAGIIREGLDDDEDNNFEEIAQMALWEGTKSFGAGVPFVREAVSAAEGFNAGGAIGGFMRSLADMGTQIKQGEVDAAALKSVNTVLGTLLKYPTSQVHKTGQAAWEDTPWNDVQWWEYFTGIRREQ